MMYTNYEHVVHPGDNLNHDVVIVSKDGHSTLTTQSFILASNWLNLFDSDYKLELKNYGPFERLFIYTDLNNNVLKNIITYLNERRFVFKNNEEMVETLDIAEKFSLTCLIKSCLKNVYYLSIKNITHLFWGWKLACKYNEAYIQPLWEEILYNTPLYYSKDENIKKGFIDLKLCDLLSFLKSQHLNVYKEKQVLEMALFWYKFNHERYSINYQWFLNVIFSCFIIQPKIEKEFMKELIENFYSHITLTMFPKLKKEKCRYPRDIMIQLGGVHEGKSFSKIQIYDPRDEQWFYIPDIALPPGYTNLSSATISTKIYITGGSKKDIIFNDIYELDMSTYNCTRLPGMTFKRCFHQTLEYNGEIYVLGGKAKEKTLQRLSSFEKYNPKTKSWITLKPMPCSRSDFGAVIINNYLIACGGYSNGYILNSTSIYNFNTDQWYEGPSMNIPRKGHGLVKIDDNKIVVLGGFSHNLRSSSCEILNLDNNVFEYFPSMIVGRSNFASTFYNGKIYVCGGFTNQGFTNVCEVFDKGGWKRTNDLLHSISTNNIVIMKNIKFSKALLDFSTEI